MARHKDRLRFPEKQGARDTAYEFESLDYPAVQLLLNSYFAEFFPVSPEKLRRHQHPGAEFLYVLAGTLAIHIGDEEHVLESQDSIYFDSSVPHAYRRAAMPAMPSRRSEPRWVHDVAPGVQYWSCSACGSVWATDDQQGPLQIDGV